MSVGIWNHLVSQPLVLPHLNALDDFRRQFLAQAREALLKLAEALMEQEANELAGQAYVRRPKRGDSIVRAGSDPATVRIGGQRVQVRKQRLKQGHRELPLQSFQALRKGDLLTEKVMNSMIHGLSTRNYDQLLEDVAGGLGLEKSSVSRVFTCGSRQALEHLQNRSLVGKLWCAIQVDATHFANRSVIVALGIDSFGKKWILGLREGTTESAEVCLDLFRELVSRGLHTEQPFLFVLDGGKGLKKAVREMFGDHFPVQRCLIHKARNIEEYLPERVRGEFRRRWGRIRRAGRYTDALFEYRDLRKWLEAISIEALASLDEAGEEELLTIYRIGVGQILSRALRSTNHIEVTFAKVKQITKRVKNWNPPRKANSKASPDQIKRWCAVALLAAEHTASYVQGATEIAAFRSRMITQKDLPTPGTAA